MARLLERLMSSHFRHGGVPTQKCFNEIVEIILYMLNKDVVDHCKNSFHYFQVIKSYVQLGTKSCSHADFTTRFSTPYLVFNRKFRGDKSGNMY
ncbi:uncharacterized protein LOC144620620 isoform X1 [Crassostrea virginica]